jgi:type IV secretory pathway VirB3-like protein
MHEPFPDEIDVPYGLTHIRMVWGLPVWIFALLLMLALAPLYLWGWHKWWVSLLCVGLGALVAAEAAHDPQFLSAWIGELKLKDYYD